MGKVRFLFALFMAKMATLALRITHHNGTNFPGIVALKICPQFLHYVSKPKFIIGVTGTNGKTTTSNLICDALRSFGREVLNNSAGANIQTGIATLLANSVSMGNKQPYDTAVLEVDERASRIIFPAVQPDVLVVTNLSRDSVMRNAHPAFIKGILEQSIPKKTKLILNADDLLSAFLCPSNEHTYFGIGPLSTDKKACTNLIDDMRFCPHCHGRLVYDYNRYSNIGRARCVSCNFHSPDYDFEGTHIDAEKGTFEVLHDGRSTVYPLLDSSLVNIYNELTLVVVLSTLGYSEEEIQKAVSSIRITASRLSAVTKAGVTFRAMLAKDRNAYAVSRVFEIICSHPGEKQILFYSNNFDDDVKWSENVCWLYDCDFELLTDPSIKKVITTGNRGMDYKLRLQMAGVPKERIAYVEDPLTGVDAVDFSAGQNIYLLYGTDPRTPAPKVRKQILERLETLEREEENHA